MHDPETTHDHAPATNTSGNRPFEDVLNARMGRRMVLGGTLAGAIGTLFASPATAAARTIAAGPKNQSGRRSPRPLMGFEPIPLNFSDQAVVSPDYTMEVLIPWGTPLSDGTPGFSWPPSSAADQSDQVGIGHDGMWFFPLNHKSNDHGVLVINHEFGTNNHVLGQELPSNAEQVAVSQAAHGCSAIEIMRDDSGTWQVVPSDRSRRITVNTPVEFSGPVAGSPLLDNPAGNEPQGTLNNCANGYTPWGTYLTCEENFNGYFGTEGGRLGGRRGPAALRLHYHRVRLRVAPVRPPLRSRQSRLRQRAQPFRLGGRGRSRPDPTAPPVKHTALGRVKHEGFAASPRSAAVDAPSATWATTSGSTTSTSSSRRRNWTSP